VARLTPVFVGIQWAIIERYLALGRERARGRSLVFKQGMKPSGLPPQGITKDRKASEAGENSISESSPCQLVFHTVPQPAIQCPVASLDLGYLVEKL
jgi:hypothetical protein